MIPESATSEPIGSSFRQFDLKAAGLIPFDVGHTLVAQGPVAAGLRAIGGRFRLVGHAHLLHAAQVTGAARMTGLATGQNIVVIHLHARPAGSTGMAGLAVLAAHQGRRDVIDRFGLRPGRRVRPVMARLAGSTDNHAVVHGCGSKWSCRPVA